MDQPHAKKRTFDHSPLAEPIDRSISTDCTTKKKNKEGKKNLPPRREIDHQTRWLALATNGGPTSLVPRCRCATPKQRGSRGGSKGFTQPPSASNPLPPSASDQARTNHEGPVISCR
ncbi:hypothetical protein PGT21_029763 [Puccinia graminis f. sp. tritici]|uniref:Uncharacterized protein n=1 Tax=Puccinia graminis f. sp. tritici TaxID=56615 RepID=A0A5B0P9B2_PUCGR|nr:hypothetical protein PGT21_029763 [Puccinia graminis f. sp. tritici]